MKCLIKKLLETVLPRRLYAGLFGAYHRTLAALGAYAYRNPSRRLFVIGVTGTKGKSTTVELIRAILEEAGLATAAASTIRFSIAGEEEPNLFKMTMPGRFFLQKFLSTALARGCTHAVIEMTSEGALQFRHKGIDLDALVFTNLQREHLERHGSMENYAQAKLSIARHLAQSPKRPRIIVANADDAYGAQFLETPVEVRAPFSRDDARPYSADEKGARFLWRTELYTSPLPGAFNLDNMLAALALAEAIGLPPAAGKRALEKLAVIPGRAERVDRGQPFIAVVDYAHTPDSLRALYDAYSSRKRICVLGSTGGGRDVWKRPEMGKVADECCETAILTNEDPYDEDPRAIVDGVARGFTKHKPKVIMDRRRAIREALKLAFIMRPLRPAQDKQTAGDQEGVAVLITGKGTDPFIMGAHGTRTPWSDKRVVEEELDKLLKDRR